MVDRPHPFDPDHIPSRLEIAEQERLRLRDAARQFRRAPTRSEDILWQELRASKLGVKFRRQHPIGPLVVDFCCPQLRLIVEIDGPIHAQQGARDAARQGLLEDRGYQIFRLTAAEVEADRPAAMERIRAAMCECGYVSPST